MNAEIMNDPDCAEQHAEVSERRDTAERAKSVTWVGFKPAGMRIWHVYQRTRNAWRRAVVAGQKTDFDFDRYDRLIDEAIECESELRELLRDVE